MDNCTWKQCYKCLKCREVSPTQNKLGLWCCGDDGGEYDCNTPESSWVKGRGTDDGNSIYYVISRNLKQNEASQVQLTPYSIDLQHQETEEYFFNNYIYTCWKANPVISTEDPNIRKIFSELSLTPASLFYSKKKFQDVV